MFTSLINLSARQSWREFGPSSDAQPPPFNTYIPSHKEHIPHSSCRKDTHLPLSQIPAMFSGNVALSFCVPPLRRPRPPLTRAKNATNYWGSRQWSLSFNPWQVLLGYYQDVNGRDRAVWHSRDCEGFRGAHLHERALLHQLCFDITYCWIFIKRRNHFGSTKQKTHRGDSDTRNSSVRYVGDTQVQNEAWRGGLRRGDAYEILHSSQLYQADMRRCQRGRPRLLWYGSLLSPQMNPAGSDLATVRQLQHKAHSL